MSILTNDNIMQWTYLQPSSVKLGGNVVFYDLNQNDWSAAQCMLGSSALPF
jgi:hypothetical protein